jgi:heparinase II/III-like protein
MDSAEIASRLRQEFDKRADLFRSQVGFAFHEEPGVAAANANFFFDSSDIPAVLQNLRTRLPEQAKAIVQEAERICAHQFRLLGYSGVDYGPNIDWHLDAVHQVRSPRKAFFRINYFDPSEVGDAKITWELSRHQHLVVLAKAYRLTNDPRFAQECFAQWYSWQEQNVYPIGIHWSSSLEVAFRSLSWLWVSFLLAGCDVVPPTFQGDLLRALSVNGRYILRFLSTYTSPNTHLLGEAVGLFFLGTLCPQLPSARRWQQTGWRIILEEAVRQVRLDGFHFEQSTYYLVYALDFFLHARLLAARNQIVIPEWFDQILVKMLEALSLLGQSGLPPSFGDDDGGRVFDPSRNRREYLLDPLATGAVVFERSDFKSACGSLREETLWLMGPNAVRQFDEIPFTPQTGSSGALKKSGLYVMLGADTPPTQLVIDAGLQGTHNAGHGHADALSVHLSANGQEFLCDPGTFEYCGDGRGRAWFRSTRAHNTLAVDGRDQAEPMGPFAWASLPDTKVERWITGRNFEVFRASHNGYARLESPVIHERWVVHFKGLGWLIRDVALGSGSHNLDLPWHLGPNLSVNGENISGEKPGAEMRFLVAGPPGWSQELCDEWWSPAYGVKIPARTIHLRFTGSLPTEFATFFEPAATNQPNRKASLQFESAAEPAVRAYSYLRDADEFCVLFTPSAQHWSWLQWSSDADLLCYHSSGGRLKSLLLCNASFVDWQGHRLWSNAQPVPWRELASRGEALEVISNTPAAASVPCAETDPTGPSY